MLRVEMLGKNTPTLVIPFHVLSTIECNWNLSMFANLGLILIIFSGVYCSNPFGFHSLQDMKKGFQEKILAYFICPHTCMHLIISGRKCIHFSHTSEQCDFSDLFFSCHWIVLTETKKQYGILNVCIFYMFIVCHQIQACWQRFGIIHVQGSALEQLFHIKCKFLSGASLQTSCCCIADAH